MKAVVCDTYGGPDVLEVKEVEKPIPNDDEVLIKVHSSSVTAGDCRIMNFRFSKWFYLPGKVMFGFSKPRKKVPGWEVSGVVESVGKDVKDLKIGDNVFGFNKGVSFGGTNAQYKCLQSYRAIPFIEKKMSHEQACVLPIGGLTALYFLKLGGVIKGMKVLIIGASGSVGTYAVQLAKHLGADVTGICSGRNIELVKSLGADHTIDYTKEDYTKGEEKYDVIFDSVDRSSFKKCKGILKEGGSFMTVDWPIFQAIFVKITSKKKLLFGMAPDNMEDLEYLKKLVETHKIKPVIDRVYQLEEAKEAYHLVNSGRKRGNILLKING
jgi:NADPH:quinone reductase-like Zn-dependent oxidoreductase